MNNFRITKKGYDIAQVDNYISSLNSGFEMANGELRVRIGDLNVEIDKLRAELKQSKEREELITKTLTKAVEKAEEIEYASKVRFALEGERLKIFKDKWIHNFKSYANTIKPNWEKEISQYFDSLKSEVYTMFKNEFSVTEYINQANDEYVSEKQRLSNK